MKICCKVFEKIAEEFDWMSYVNNNGEKILIMPHIVTDYVKYRINKCPSCGAKIRDIEINETQFNSFKNETNAD